MDIFNKKPTHAEHLERWLGYANVERLSESMKGWYGPPIAVKGVPGNVYVDGTGDFHGKITAGEETSALDRGAAFLHKAKRAIEKSAWKGARRTQLNAGFASLSDLISEATAGAKRQEWAFSKAGSTGVVGASNSMWAYAGYPAPLAAPGVGTGTVCTSANGGFPIRNADGGDTLHFVSGYPVASVAANNILMYDRLYHWGKTMNATTETSTGTPTRYTSTTATNADYIGGNFLFVEVGTASLTATGHNWTMVYVNQTGTASSTTAALAGVSGPIAHRLDHIAPHTWFLTPNSGDSGIYRLVQIAASASITAGTLSVVQGHPIAWMPCPVANMVCVADGINTAFNLTRIFDNACLHFLEVAKPATGATNYTGSFTLVSG